MAFSGYFAYLDNESAKKSHMFNAGQASQMQPLEIIRDWACSDDFTTSLEDRRELFDAIDAIAKQLGED